MAGLDDSSLVRDCVEGRPQAFDVLVDRYYKVLFNVALRIIGDPEEARDITQTTFMKVYENLGTYDPKRKFFSWIYRIAVNESINAKGRRKPLEPVDIEFVARGDTPEQVFEKQRLHESIQGALMKLSLEHRQVVVLRHFGDLSYKDIASALDIPEKTVKSRLFEARRQLCTILIKGRAAT